MRSYTLNIARYIIRIESSPEGPELIPSERFRRNICETDGNYDVLVRVHNGTYKLSEEADRVFVAPYIIESNGYKVQRYDNFWSVYRQNSDLFIITNFPEAPRKKAILKLSLTLREWDLWIENAGDGTDPLDYPLDGLVLYYLTAINADIMIHASGVNYDGQGYLFSGVSGKGKSTMAGLWYNIGAQVVHDDRLIIRCIDGVYRMFNTPVYRNDEPAESVISSIFLIDHAPDNHIIPIREASAVTLVMANCIQHNYSPDMIARFLGSVSLMCSKIPISKLSFKPDRSIIEYILKKKYESSCAFSFEGDRVHTSC
ncbi:MAG: hypothetical protein WAL29_09620 [Bacteroidales bacterium]